MKIDVKKIFEELLTLMREGFHGKVVLSFFEGKITNIRKEHSVNMEKFKVEDGNI